MTSSTVHPLADPLGDAPDTDVKSVTGAQTLERGLDLLEIATLEPMTIAELMRQSGLPRGVVYRLVAALSSRGFLTTSEDGRLRGGSKLLQLGHFAAAYNDLVPLASPHIEGLAARTGLSAFFGRRDGDYSVHLLRSSGTERLTVTTQPGARRLLPETGLGKALMLDDDRRDWERLFGIVEARFKQVEDWHEQLESAARSGVVLQRGPAPDLINSVASPVRNAGGKIVAAVNVAAAAQYLDADRMQMVAPLVIQTALAISTALGATPRPIAG